MIYSCLAVSSVGPQVELLLAKKCSVNDRPLVGLLTAHSRFLSCSPLNDHVNENEARLSLSHLVIGEK